MIFFIFFPYLAIPCYKRKARQQIRQLLQKIPVNDSVIRLRISFPDFPSCN